MRTLNWVGTIEVPQHFEGCGHHLEKSYIRSDQHPVKSLSINATDKDTRDLLTEYISIYPNAGT